MFKKEGDSHRQTWTRTDCPLCPASAACRQAALYEMPYKFRQVRSPASPVILHHGLALRVRKTTLFRAFVGPYRVIIAAHVFVFLLTIAHVGIAARRRAVGLLPSCPGSTHHVPAAIWYPRCSGHRTYRARFAGQRPSRCGCKGCRCARPRARGRIREETWHSDGLWWLRRISKYVDDVPRQCGWCANYGTKNCWTTPRLTLCIIPYVACFLIFEWAPLSPVAS